MVKTVAYMVQSVSVSKNIIKRRNDLKIYFGSIYCGAEKNGIFHCMPINVWTLQMTQLIVFVMYITSWRNFSFTMACQLPPLEMSLTCLTIFFKHDLEWLKCLVVWSDQATSTRESNLGPLAKAEKPNFSIIHSCYIGKTRPFNVCNRNCTLFSVMQSEL